MIERKKIPPSRHWLYRYKDDWYSRAEMLTLDECEVSSTMLDNRIKQAFSGEFYKHVDIDYFFKKDIKRGRKYYVSKPEIKKVTTPAFVEICPCDDCMKRAGCVTECNIFVQWSNCENDKTRLMIASNHLKIQALAAE